MRTAAQKISTTALFDEFLQAHIRQEKNGMMLSVISALGRLNLDPWAEASRLAEMPKNAAFLRLRQLVFETADKPQFPSEIDDIAARLTNLLPGQKTPVLPDRRRYLKKQTGTSKTFRFSSDVRVIIIIGSIVFWLGIQLSSGTHSSPRHPDHSLEANGDLRLKADSKR